MTQTYFNKISYKDYISKAISTLGIGLCISAVIAFILEKINFLNIIFSFGGASIIFVLGSAILEIVVAFYFSSRLYQMSKSTAWVCYILYCVLTGISLSTLISFYSDASVAFAFLSTAILFICMAIIGNTTKFDLTRISNLLFVGLLAIIIISLINLFLRLPFIDISISYISVIIFLFMVAYDTQKLKSLYNASIDNDMNEKLMIMAAFQLYLDFINLFIRILQIFGKRDRDN